MKISALAAVTVVLSVLAVPVAEAGGKVTGSEFHSGGASAAPSCDGIGRSQKTANDGRLFGDRCRVIAGDGGPGGPTDGTGRSQTADDGPVGAGDHNGRSAALSQGGGEFRIAGGGKVGSDFGH